MTGNDEFTINLARDMARDAHEGYRKDRDKYSADFWAGYLSDMLRRISETLDPVATEEYQPPRPTDLRPTDRPL